MKEWFVIAIIYLIVLFTLYAGITWGTYQKIIYNGITFNLKYKLYLTLLPSLLIIIYMQNSLKLLKIDSKLALSTFFSVFTKYPIIIGCFIEISLESIAEHVVYGESRILRVDDYSEESPVKVSFNLNEVIDYFKSNSPYMKTEDIKKASSLFKT